MLVPHHMKADFKTLNGFVMKSNAYLLLLICSVVLSALLFMGCTKERLPRATEKGKNTFGCKIDGKVFLPSEDEPSFSAPSSPLLVSNNSFDGFILRARKFGTPTSTPKNVIIALPYIKTTGTYPLAIYGYGVYKEDYAGGPIYRTNNTYTGQVKITRSDTINRIYSGTFSFTAIDENTGKVVNVTDGRFDVKRP